MRVAALTAGRNDPSSRFRVRQFVRPLGRLGIEVEEYRPWIGKYAAWPLQLTGLPLASRVMGLIGAARADVTWLNRELVHGHATLEGLVRSPCVFDVDDAIWCTSRSEFARRIAGRCAGVIAANETIAAYFSGSAPQVWIVPTCVDTERWRPAKHGYPLNGPFVIGWSGTWWNLKYLLTIESVLAEFLHTHPDAHLRVVCDRRPSFRLLPTGRWSFEQWTPEREVRALQDLTVGIMPLADDEWTRAKSATKMLCYLAVGCPAVVSPVGMAKEVLAQAEVGYAARDASEWFAHLHQLYEDRSQAQRLGANGPGLVGMYYSVAGHTPRLAEIFSEVRATC